ncbi:MAG: hypothetical protein H7A23_04320 [Leptospiraceae bacterium]|nr:hypothetical protein [Leptospiraceae bacterium]MCP5493758.1 hypothetical protein [Leptospiraceae bacterium]
MGNKRNLIFGVVGTHNSVGTRRVVSLLVAIFFVLCSLNIHAEEKNIFEQKKQIDSHINKGEYQNAATLLHGLLENEPEYVEGYNKLGYCYIMMNQPNEALKYYEKSDSISPNLDAKSGIQWALLLQGKPKDSIEAGEKALKMDPNSYWVKLRMEQAKKQDIYPLFYITPLYSSFDFHKSSVLGIGNKAGLGISAVFSPNWVVNAGYYKIHVNNLIPKEGYKLYVINPYNLVYYQYYNNIQDFLSYYYTGTYNLYQFYQIATGKDFEMKDYTLGTTYYKSASESYWFSAHYLSSNDDYTNSGKSLNIGGTWGLKNKFTAAIGAVSFPKHKGGQLSFSYNWNVFGPLWSDTMIMGQALSLETTDYVIYSLSPIGFYTTTEKVSKSYASAQQTISLAFKWFSIGGGGRGGNGYTPIFGKNQIYSPSVMKTGLLGFLNVYYFQRVNFNITYSYDKWLNSLNEIPYSRTWTFSLTARLP